MLSALGGRRTPVAGIDELDDPCETGTEPHSRDAHEFELDPSAPTLPEAEDCAGADAVWLTGPAARDRDDTMQYVVLRVIGIYREPLTAIHRDASPRDMRTSCIAHVSPRSSPHPAQIRPTAAIRNRATADCSSDLLRARA